MKFIIAGDFGQLPPVDDKRKGDYENSPALHMLCGGNRIKLTKCRWSDSVLFRLCENVDSIIKADFKPTTKTYLNLAYTHRTRIRVNKECMERYNSEFPSETVFVPKSEMDQKQNSKCISSTRNARHLSHYQQEIENPELPNVHHWIGYRRIIGSEKWKWYFPNENERLPQILLFGILHYHPRQSRWILLR